MAHTNSTPNYNLPQFLGTDKPAWLTDVNNAMSDIDGAIAAAKSTADTADATATALGVTVGNHTTQLSTLSGAVTSQGNTLNTVTSLIGNGVPTTTDQTIIGAINELHANQGDLANLTTVDKSSLVAAINEAAQGGGSPAASAVSYDNTGSGLTATNVQDAIDELAVSSGKVSVTGNGVKTVSALFDELFALVDFTKVTRHSVLSINDGVEFFHIAYKAADNSFLKFTQALIAGTDFNINVAEIKATASVYTSANRTSNSDLGSIVVTNGNKIAIYY